MAVYKYTFDRYGNAPANLLIDDPYSFTVSDIKAFIPRQSLFYTDSVVIKIQATGTTLVPDTDYEFTNYDPNIVALTGLEAAAGIQLSDTTFTGTILLTCQLVGGPEGHRSEALIQLTDALATANNSPTIDWNTQIANRPTHFPAALVEVLPSQLKDLDLLSQEFRRFADALQDNRPMHDSYHNIAEQQHRTIQLVGRMRKDLNSVIAIAGSGQIISDLQDSINSIETVISGTQNTFAGIASTVGSWDVGSFTRISGVLSYLSASGTHSLNVEIAHDGTNTVWSKINELETAGDLFNLSTNESGGKLHLNITPTENGVYTIKWLAVI